MHFRSTGGALAAPLLRPHFDTRQRTSRSQSYSTAEMQTTDRHKTIALFDVDGTLSVARKVRRHTSHVCKAYTLL